MDFETIAYERRGAIGLLTLNRPDRLNAVNFAMSDELSRFWQERMQDDDCRVLVITGAGRGFCAGLDMKDSAAVADVARYEPGLAYRLQKSYSDIIQAMRRAPQPIVAAINGAAAGAGLSFALASDIRLAAPGAKMSAAYINIGVGGADLGSSWFLARMAGLGNAARWLYTGDVFLAEEAYRIGLVQELVPAGELMDNAMALAEKIASKSPLGLRLTKEALDRNAAGATLDEAIKMEDRNQSMCIAQMAHRARSGEKD